MLPNRPLISWNRPEASSSARARNRTSMRAPTASRRSARAARIDPIEDGGQERVGRSDGIERAGQQLFGERRIQCAREEPQAAPERRGVGRGAELLRVGCDLRGIDVHARVELHAVGRCGELRARRGAHLQIGDCHAERLEVCAQGARGAPLLRRDRARPGGHRAPRRAAPRSPRPDRRASADPGSRARAGRARARAARRRVRPGACAPRRGRARAGAGCRRARSCPRRRGARRPRRRTAAARRGASSAGAACRRARRARRRSSRRRRCGRAARAALRRPLAAAQRPGRDRASRSRVPTTSWNAASSGATSVRGSARPTCTMSSSNTACSSSMSGWRLSPSRAPRS